jgi:hypothetical protein
VLLSQEPLSLFRLHRTRGPDRSYPVMAMPEPQVPQRSNPDNKRFDFGRLREAGVPASKRLARAASNSLSSRIRSSGTCCTTHSLSGFVRVTRRPVFGSLTDLLLFQMTRPTNRSFKSRPWPRAVFPLMVEAFHFPPRGAGMLSAFKAAAMARGEAPATYSS